MVRRLVASLAFAAGLVVQPASPALGGVFTVTKTGDTADGVCDADCSLREAIIAANASADARNRILLGPGTHVLTIPFVAIDDPTAGDFNITASMTIEGAGRDVTIVDGEDRDRLFSAAPLFGQPGIDVRFKHLTIRRGRAFYGTSNGSNRSGGGILARGDTRLTVFDCVVESSTAIEDGGGIGAEGRILRLLDSVVRDNSSGNVGGGVANFLGYGEHNLIRRSEIRGNRAVYRGCGILNAGWMTIEDSLIADNSCTAFFPEGGGIATANTLTTIRNTTISGNQAYTGGGVFTVGHSFEFTNVTIADNVATGFGDGIYFPVSAPTTFANTLFARNGCATPGPGVPLAVTSLGGNLETGDTCGLAHATDQVDVADAMVDPLADNGGATETHALLAGSPAIDGGVDALCIGWDQRTLERTDDACDAGAFEAGAASERSACGAAELADIFDDLSFGTVGCVVVGLRGRARLG